jgi:hypothetical protein
MKVNVADAILALEPTAEFSVTSEDLDKIEWFSEGVTQPSKSAIQSKLDELQAIEDNKQYQRDRAAEYPSIPNQLDDIFHNGLDGWKATIQETKDKYPKP